MGALNVRSNHFPRYRASDLVLAPLALLTMLGCQNESITPPAVSTATSEVDRRVAFERIGYGRCWEG